MCFRGLHYAAKLQLEKAKSRHTIYMDDSPAHPEDFQFSRNAISLVLQVFTCLLPVFFAVPQE